MQKKIGLVLLGIGMFLLVVAILCVTWVPGAVKKTPIDTVSNTYLTGTAEKLNPETGKVEDLNVKILSVTKTDADKSDDTVVSWVNTTCVVIDEGNPPDCVDKNDPEGRLVSATVDTFATDRYTALAVNDKKYLAKDSTVHEGLVNKFPFDTQKKTYPYWDGMLGKTVDAKYVGTKTFDGLETYEFHIDVPKTAAEIVEGIEGFYSTDIHIFVEPLTGAPIQQTQHETRTLENGDPVLDLDVAFTDATIKASVKDAEKNVSSLELLTKTVPTIGFIVGPLLLLIGAALVLLARREDGSRKA